MWVPYRSAPGIVMLLGIVGAPLGSSASAKDLEMLARLLIPAYMAQNFAVLCVDQDAQFLSDLKEGMTPVAAFAEHVKQELATGLAESEAGEVRVTAADAARNVARQEMQLLGGQKSGVPASALKSWCERSAKHFITEIMAKHREKHGEFERLMEAAKR